MAIPWPLAGAGLSALPKPGAWMVRVKQVFGVFILGDGGLLRLRGVRALRESLGRCLGGHASVEEKLKAGWHASLAEGLAAAEREQKPVLIDLWATWCKNCLTMDKTTLADAEVTGALSNYVKIKFQAENPDDAPAKQVMQKFGAVGLPTYVILRPQRPTRVATDPALDVILCPRLIAFARSRDELHEITCGEIDLQLRQPGLSSGPLLSSSSTPNNNSADSRSRVRAFDVIAREAVGGAVRVSERPSRRYVAAGQGLGFWMSKVDAFLESATSRVDELRQVAVEPRLLARRWPTPSASVEDLRAIDKRAREYLHTDQPLMAADVVFSEGGETAATASRQIEAARSAEHLAWDAAEAAVRTQQAVRGTGGAGPGERWPSRCSCCGHAPGRQRPATPFTAATGCGCRRRLAPNRRARVAGGAPEDRASRGGLPGPAARDRASLKAAADFCTELEPRA